MKYKKTHSGILASVIVLSVISVIIICIAVYESYFNIDSIEYDGHGYKITSQITDEKEITSIRKQYPYNGDKYHGCKIYADKKTPSSGEIYVQKINGKFYNLSLRGSM